MKKFISLLLAAILIIGCVSLFAGCQPKNGTLVMGTNAAFPPYEFLDEKGDFTGIDVEIAKAIAKELDMKLEIKDMEFNSLLFAVQEDSIDIVLAGLTVSDERKEKVDFTQTYATGKQVIIVKADSAIASADDLDGKTIGTQAGTTGDIYCTDDYGQDAVKPYDNGALAIKALINGQVDCVVIDNEPAKVFVQANEGLKILETEYVIEDYAAAISKNNPELLAKVDAAITKLKEDGTIDKILAKYINAD